MCRPRVARPGITAGQRHALAECRLPPAGAGAVEPPSKSLATRCSLDQRWRLSPTTRSGFLVRKPHYARKKTPISDSDLEDAYLVNEIFDLYRQNNELYGIRKMWHALRRCG